MMFDRKQFFAELRKRDSGLFGTRLTQGQVDGVDAILDEGVKRRVSLRHMAYILATSYHEVGGTMQPKRESLNYSVAGLLKTFGRHRITEAQAKRYGRSGSRKADQKAIANIIYGGSWGRENLGNEMPGDGWLFRGGGLPQLTGRRNFAKFGLAKNPDSIMDLRTSVRIMFDGMLNGLYTGKRLDDYTDYLSMRRTVNGTDRAETIAGYAESFECALRAAGWGVYPVAAPDVPKPTPKPVQDVVDDAARGGTSSTTNIATGVGAASSTVAIVKEATDAAKNTTDSVSAILAVGPWVLLLVVALGAGWWIWRERQRKSKAAAAAQKVM